MADNILKGIIKLEAQGVAQVAAQTSTAIKSVSTSLQKVAQPANQAGNALINLSRVVQDAPFGFIGIANNLNPLLESFQRLKVSTGTTGGAFKALGKELLGAGGLGFAVSAVSSLLVVFGGNLFGASKAAKDAEEKTNKLKAAVDGVFSSVAKEATEVTSLVTVLRSETETRERKLAAMNELKKIQPDIFNGLKLEGTAVLGLDAAYQQYLANLKTVITAKVTQAQLEAKIEALLRAQGVTLVGNQKVLADGTKRFLDNIKKDTKADPAQGGLVLQNVLGTEADAKKRIDNLQNEINQLIENLGEVLKGLKLDTDVVTVKPKKVKIDKPDYVFVENPTVFDVLNPDLSRLQKQIADISKEIRLNIPIGIDLSQPIKGIQNLIARNSKALEEIRKPAIELANAFNEAFSNAISGGLTSFGEGLGNLLSGKDFGSGLINVLGDLISNLGKALVKYGAIKAGIDKVFGPGGFAIPGGVAIALGVAALAAGQAFKNFGGFRAAGGPVSGSRAYVVGEKGPELFVPNMGGGIIPNNRISGSFAGSGGGRVEFVISGNVLRGILTKANRSALGLE